MEPAKATPRLYEGLNEFEKKLIEQALQDLDSPILNKREILTALYIHGNIEASRQLGN